MCRWLHRHPITTLYSLCVALASYTTWLIEGAAR